MHPYKEQLLKLNFNARDLSLETQAYIKQYNDSSANLNLLRARVEKATNEDSKAVAIGKLTECEAEITRLAVIIEERILLEYKDMNPEPAPEPTPEPTPAPEPEPTPEPAPASKEKESFRLFRFKNKENKE